MADAKTTTECAFLASAFTPLISFILGFLSAVFAEPVRERLFRPILKLSFTGQDDTVAKTKTIAGIEAVYVRVKVVNTKRKLARAVRAYLIIVEVETSKKCLRSDHLHRQYPAGLVV
jgi:hypothetical protein